MRTCHFHHQLPTLWRQSSAWADQRHLQTLLWMVIGLICREWTNLSKWRVYVKSRAKFAQSYQQRFSRWLHNPRITHPASASKKQVEKRLKQEFTVNSYCFVQSVMSVNQVQYSLFPKKLVDALDVIKFCDRH